MTIIDQSLLLRTRRRTRPDGLTPEQRIAINLFWRQGVRAGILARVFGVSRNTIYYSCLTGTAPSYRDMPQAAKMAIETNKFIDGVGAGAAWKKFVKDEWVRAVNAAMEDEVTRREG